MRITFTQTRTYKQNATNPETGEKFASAHGGPGGDHKHLYDWITYEAGKTYDLDDNHAQRWLKRNVATPALPGAKVTPLKGQQPAVEAGKK